MNSAAHLKTSNPQSGRLIHSCCSKNSNLSWGKIQSAAWVNIQSALTCYRFVSQTYECSYDLLREQSPKAEYLRNYSAQAAYLIENNLANINSPTHYEHLAENFLKIVKIYAELFHPSFDVELDKTNGLSDGLCLVRNIRNQVVHGTFPIIEDPEYAFEFNEPHTKRNIVNLLCQASRIAAINIQMLLASSSEGFESDGYESMCMDDEYGKYFEENCTFSYLLNLHLIQKFGLNESDYFSLSSEINES